jgi:antitoxin ParD1/3/4
MQIILNSRQSKILESLSQQGGYASPEDALDNALALLADEVGQQNLVVNPDYLEWVEQTRIKIDAGIQAAEQGDVVEAEAVITRLRQKVNAAKTATT